MTKIEFFFDLMSPFAYLASHRLAKIAQKYDVSVAYKAIDLSKAKLAIGNDGPSNRSLPVKLHYLMTDLQRWAKRYDIALTPVKNHNSHLLNVGLLYAIDRDQSAQYVATAFRHTWGEGGAPDDIELLGRVASQMGWKNDDFQGFIYSAAATQRYGQYTDDAIKKGVFGVPTVIVDGHMWWGNDRLDFVEEYLEHIS